MIYHNLINITSLIGNLMSDYFDHIQQTHTLALGKRRTEDISCNLQYNTNHLNVNCKTKIISKEIMILLWKVNRHCILFSYSGWWRFHLTVHFIYLTNCYKVSEMVLDLPEFQATLSAFFKFSKIAIYRAPIYRKPK